MSHLGYEFINIVKRSVKGNKYLTAQFRKSADASEYPYHETERETLDMISLQTRLVDIIVDDFSCSQSDINQLMEGITALRKAYKENPDHKFSWRISHRARKNEAKERIQEHNKECKEVLEYKGISEKHKNIDFKFEPIPANE